MKILEPITVKNVTFKNRVTIAPSHPYGYGPGPDHTFSDDNIDYYRRRLKNQNIGLLITQRMQVQSRDAGRGNFALISQDQKEKLKVLVDAAHENGTKIFAQIGFPSTGHHRHESVDFWRREDLKAIEEMHVHSARLAKEAGCDGVEIHGCNMFFLNLFNSPITNHRIDEYGGNLEGRLKLSENIIKGIKEFADDNFLIDYRMGWNSDLQTDIETAKKLEEFGIDIFHISYGVRESDRYMPFDFNPVIAYPGTTREKQIAPADYPYGDVVYTGAQIKKNLSIPVILVDEIWTYERGEKLLENGDGDFIAYSRPFMADPDFSTKSEVNPGYSNCLKCVECAWFSDFHKCPRVLQRGFERA
ncbi:MAG: NADH:flavin oxidoreductase [Butyrivibrio sp.]|nr:NADH:flavin oxidoreductase [Butyrivibrio sp.]